MVHNFRITFTWKEASLRSMNSLTVRCPKTVTYNLDKPHDASPSTTQAGCTPLSTSSEYLVKLSETHTKQFFLTYERRESPFIERETFIKYLLCAQDTQYLPVKSTPFRGRREARGAMGCK